MPGRRGAAAPFGCGAESDDLVRRESTGPQAALLPATEEQRLQQRARRLAHIERPDALRPVELVGGESREIDRQLAERQRHLAGRLRAVAMQGDAALAAQAADGRY